LESAESRMKIKMNRICRELAQIPESSRALPLLLMFSASLMRALFIVRWNADLNFDGEIYISAARKYAVGMYREGLAIYPMPIYPYLISLMHSIISNWVLAGRLISYFSMTLTVIPLYLLSKDLFNRRASFWGCVAFILLPETLLHSNCGDARPAFLSICHVRGLFSPKGARSSPNATHAPLSFSLVRMVFNPLLDRRFYYFSGIFRLSHRLGHLQKIYASMSRLPSLENPGN
jgi:Dolichyl-phosphate-mannose-protein mannosyltransferase